MKKALIVFCLGVFAINSFAGEATGKLDLSKLELPIDDIAVIEENIPVNIASSLIERQIVAEALNAYITAGYYRKSGPDSVSDTFILYCSNGLGRGNIRILEYKDTTYTLTWETEKAPGGGWVDIEFTDIDCDSINEIIARSISATGNWSMIIIKNNGSQFGIISPSAQGESLSGRLIEFKDIDHDCIKEIKTFQDGAEKYDMSIQKVYILDEKTKTYRFKSTEKDPPE